MNSALRQGVTSAAIKDLAVGATTAGAGAWTSFYPSSPLEIATYIGALLSSVLIFKNIAGWWGERKERKQRMAERKQHMILQQIEIDKKLERENHV